MSVSEMDGSVPRSRSSRSSGSPSSVAARPHLPRRQAALKVALVTDIGGLNDKGFNELAYNGLKVAQRQLGVQGRVFISKSGSGLRPEPLGWCAQGYDLVIAVGFLMGDSIAASRRSSRRASSRSSTSRGRPQGQAEERPWHRLRRAGGRLPRRCRSCDHVRSRGTISSVGGLKIPPVDAYIAGYQYWREEGEAGHQGAQRLLAGLRRPGEVQGDRAQPDRPGLGRRVPGRRRLRPRRPLGAADTQGAWGIGVDDDQSFLGPHADERAEEGRCGRHADDQARQGRASSRAATTVSST